MLNKSNELLFKEFYQMTKKLCISLGVNIQSNMNYFKMFRAACERVSTKKLSKALTFIKDDDNWLFKKMQEIIFKELLRRGHARGSSQGDIHFFAKV
ncbi:hypothetical protein D5F11_016745 [Siminovitchia terrae]|uniref:Uncharacterized protein n=1 Tax=Siminovitchia terrae TaxID=1914933 RepID=A0A429X5M8_SIMTE|nr:hypothetical protein [Siminovitchia terrae]RST58674.1 hypothetical protein D5F11_016745 [Siminovitchia terrae]